MASENKVIEIKNVKTYVEQTKVFDGFSLDISLGCSTVILGPNGAGKTTLLKLLTRDIYPVYSEGSYIKILGQDRWNIWELRSRLGIVSDYLQANYPYYAIGVNVVLSGYYSSLDTWSHQEFSKDKIEKAEEIMEMLGIENLRDREFSRMSTGQQRRFLLGRALINQPEVLVLDEPTSGLDLKSSFQYLDIIRELISNGKTITLVTHQIHEIPPEVSRVILLKEGAVVLDGEKSSVLTDSNISDLYGIGVKLIESKGFYQAMPA